MFYFKLKSLSQPELLETNVPQSPYWSGFLENVIALKLNMALLWFRTLCHKFQTEVDFLFPVNNAQSITSENEEA